MLVLAPVLFVLVYAAIATLCGLLAGLLATAAPVTARFATLALTAGPVLDTKRVSAAQLQAIVYAALSQLPPLMLVGRLVARLLPGTRPACLS